MSSQHQADARPLPVLTPETRLTRDQLARALTEHGFPVARSTLASKASRGEDAPPYELWGRRPIYTWGTALAWARGRLSQPRSSSSAEDADRAQASRHRGGRPRKAEPADLSSTQPAGS